MLYWCSLRKRPLHKKYIQERLPELCNDSQKYQKQHGFSPLWLDHGATGKKGQMFCHIEAKFYILFKFTPIIVDDDLNVPNTKQGTFSNDFLLLYNSEILL